MTPKKTNDSAAPSDAAPEADAEFQRVVDAYAGDPRVVYGRLMASPGLKVDGKIFAMLTRGRFVAKLQKPRVDALVASGAGERFDPGHGRITKEWVVIDRGSADWLALAREAYAFVSGGAG